jgi:desulfoferrodoxin-like iron-binding protein
MSQERKVFICKLCGKEIKVLKEGGNHSPPVCCGETMSAKE